MIDGGQGFVNNNFIPTLEGPHGGGNVSIPILVCTGLELVSVLYTGKKNNSTENVRDFIKEYFPEVSPIKRIALVLWEGIRNGTNHVFIPNIVKASYSLVEFSFSVEIYANVESYVTRSDNIIEIHINSIEFYRILKESVDKYESDLRKDETLQCHFIDGWKAIEEPHDRSKDDNIPMR